MDSFFGIGVFEVVFILIIALIFLGPERLPQVIRQVVGAIRQVRSLTSDLTKQFNEEFGDLAELDPRRQIQQALKEDPAPKKALPKKTTPAKTTPAKTTTAKTGAAKTTPSPASKTVATAKKNVAATPDSDSTTKNSDEGTPGANAETASDAATEPVSSKAGSNKAEEAAGTVAVHPTPEKTSPNGESPAPSAEAGEPAEASPVQRQEPTTESQNADQSSSPAYLAQAAKPENGTRHGGDNTNHSGAAERKDVSDALATEDLETVENYSIAPPNLGEQSTDGSAEPARERSTQRAAEEENA